MTIEDLKSKNSELYRYLSEMFERADVDPEEVDITQRRWYHEYTWSLEDQEEFREWMIEELKKDPETKTFAEQKADMFILNYGFKNEKLND